MRMPSTTLHWTVSLHTNPFRWFCTGFPCPENMEAGGCKTTFVSLPSPPHPGPVPFIAPTCKQLRVRFAISGVLQTTPHMRDSINIGGLSQLCVACFCSHLVVSSQIVYLPLPNSIYKTRFFKTNKKT